MADEDKEKAEKVAAARKRYEELKKQKAKKGGGDKKKGKKNKDEGEKAEGAKAEDAGEDEEAEDDEDKGAELAARVEELEKENAQLKTDVDSKSEELDKAGKEVAELKEKAETSEKELLELNKEAEESEREIRELKKKVEASEAEGTQLRGKVEAAEKKADELTKRVADLEQQSTEDASGGKSQTDELSSQLSEKTLLADKLQAQVTSLKEDLASRSTDTTSAAPSTSADDAAKITALEADVAAAQKTAAEATSHAQELQQKVDELSKLSAPSTNPRARKSVDGDDGGLEEIEDEERRQLQARVRELEGEVYELRRGAFKEHRKQLHGEMDDDALASPGAFSDVDLNSAYGSQQQQKSRRQSSGYNTFTNVINAFTGAGQPAGRARGQSGAGAGFLEEDDDLEFDENAFKQAQEDEAKARLERIRETKRGLTAWKGWRVDLVDVRGGAMMGVFDV